MVIIFSIGLIVGVWLVITLLKVTAQEDPKGCIILYCTLVVLMFWVLILVPRIIFGG